MLKKYYFILILTIFISCDKEDANDCFQTSGTMITEEVLVEAFTKIEVNEGVNLVIKEGENQEVLIATGANLINDVEAKVVGETLFLSDNNDCNYVRDYGITTIYVTVPNLTEINSKTQFEVRSDGILTFPSITLISENFTNNNPASGNFNLQIENEELSITFNNLSNLFISGTTTLFTISIPGGNPRIEAENLLADTVIISSRGSNDILINPKQELRGDIYGTGDVIAYTKPSIITLIAHYTGSLLFN
ncbi:head GIN domain-containing protein [Kordia jejudonensis]|uniref:head GIN domain-containing protein n=1 Tax=Kordia jejudonensis TaxID=1348245 RepID=UPI000629C084|nr:head GIN domain-containing protein [Kordia jejudonensis]